MYEVIFEKKIFKFLQKHKGKKIIFIFEDSVKILKENPYKNSLDINSLKGFKNFYRIRIGKYRFIYEIIENKLIIRFTDGNSRGDIY